MFDGYVLQRPLAMPVNIDRCVYGAVAIDRYVYGAVTIDRYVYGAVTIDRYVYGQFAKKSFVMHGCTTDSDFCPSDFLRPRRFPQKPAAEFGRASLAF